MVLRSACPWQRDSNENTNGLLRQFMPKGTDLSDTSQTWLNDVAALMNDRPRKSLGWKTPAEAMAEEMAALIEAVALAICIRPAYESKGHCVVFAGPGSGKTKTLTVKLARLLSEDIQEPRGLGCITSNNECARELETRLAALGTEPGRRAFIGTVHSFSLTQIILLYAKAAGMDLPEEFCVATRAERNRALEAACKRVIGGRDNPLAHSGVIRSRFRLGRSPTALERAAGAGDAPAPYRRGAGIY